MGMRMVAMLDPPNDKLLSLQEGRPVGSSTTGIGVPRYYILGKRIN
jgi:hypothetical protein